MIHSIGGRAATAAAPVALGGAAVVAAQVPAQASVFTAPYTCTVPFVGTQSVVGTGTLTASPNPSTTGTSTHFQLQIAGLSSPLAITSWNASAGIDGSGAETSSFSVTGSGGSIPANTPITVTLDGNWTPAVTGTDQFQVGNLTVHGRVPIFGTLTISCTPVAPRPVAETLTVS